LEKKIKNRIVLGTLISVFIIYNITIYFNKVSASSTSQLSDSAIKGEKIWQNKNCTACHQLYGLGGYLGPDLTNVISNPAKGPEYAKAFFNSGIKSMPKFNFTEEEKNNLVEFLSAVDKTGYYPNKDVEFDYSGWVSIKYK
jgi:nitric oxide reductase subunit C